jgi:sigma-B regulation protein RsbU (phosphoserine phosphatase)
MGLLPSARILLGSQEQSAAQNQRQLLEHAGYEVGWFALDGSVPTTDLTGSDLVILEGGHEAMRVCRRLRTRLTDSFLPILLVVDVGNPEARLAGLEAGADACLARPFSPQELLLQVQAFLRLKSLHDRSAEKTAEFHRVNKRLEEAYQQLDEELQLARRIQQGLLPQTLPEVPPARFAVHYRPCGRVGGDFYDVFRLDEDHVGFFVADVMGHGVPASLLTVFLKKAVRTKEISGNQYRLLPPNEVLEHLNRELISQALAEHPFITMVYGLWNRTDRMLSFARAGHPYPLYIPRSGDPELWQAHGTLLGVFDTQFTVTSRQLQAGDKVLFSTDGLDLATDEGGQSGAERLLLQAGRHRQLPIQELVVRLSHELFATTAQPDDFTLLGLEILDQ